MDTFKKIFLKRLEIGLFKRLNNAANSLSVVERIVFAFFLAVFIVSAFSILIRLNNVFLVEIPKGGGVYKEAIIGSPRFVNPLIASLNADKDMVSIIFSGLLRFDGSGNLIYDLAESLDISDEGRVYTVILKDELFFHDNVKLTTEDVEFTIKKALDPLIKSPARVNWEGVEVSRIDEKTIVFKLKQPYSAFADNLTLGILPSHLWKGVESDQFSFNFLNTEPVGSGPYQIAGIKRSNGGSISSYTLKPFAKWSLPKSFISKIITIFYSSEEEAMAAFNRKEVEALGAISPKMVANLKGEQYSISSSPLPRIFGVFLNANQNNLFLNKEVRQALELATEKEAIIENVLAGYGVAISGPTPRDEDGASPLEEQKKESASSQKIEAAVELLKNKGWQFNEDNILFKKTKKENYVMSFTLTTSDSEDLKLTAELLKKQWQKLGASVEIKIFEQGDLNQKIIRPRKYEALLFGEIIVNDLDLYAFWHSSQRNDPGLNIALYTNSDVDKLLEKARVTMDSEKRALIMQEISSLIKNESPAIFIYAPEFIYIYPNKIHNVNLGKINSSSDRFLNIHNWYIETDKVWKFFVKNDNAEESQRRLFYVR